MGKKRRKHDRAAMAVRAEPLHAPIWGRELIDEGAIRQLENAMRLPVAVGGALMPDAHVGYGIPIGGVVALEDAVAPYMVGVDIACRVMMSVYPADDLDLLENASRRDQLKLSMRRETRFGIGSHFDGRDRREHEVMDDPAWDEVPQLRRLKDRAAAQLGSSGSGNHFVDAGELVVGPDGAGALGIEPGRYFAIMSHSGSRGAGAETANYFSRVARDRVRLPDGLQHLAWLTLSSEPGQQYWIAMNLMGRYASANHHTLHHAIAKSLKLKPVRQIENHHNFAWKETWNGREVYIHRKGATPAHAGALGIVPGSQGHDSFVVLGKGSVASLNSAAHGAGRTMSRRKAKNTIPKRERDRWLAERDVELLDAGMDEAPQAYKDIRRVLAFQNDLIDVIASFSPRIVLMAAGGPAED
jgi:tRNA-splicing ligase RtcB